jgi:flavin reductase (DIM6/NTAB) family NADH-FMN oxidoreductase RutF
MPMSEFSLRDLSPHDRYKLLSGIVVPRPIALVTTLDANGAVNAAPFSFFNVFSEDPPLVVLGLQHKADGTPKDTTRNIHRDGEFVVNMVDEALASAMNDCAVDFPSGESEVAATGLATLPSVDVKVPRLAAASFALECRRSVSLAFGPGRELLVGEVPRVHAREALVDVENMYVDLAAYRPIGRLFGNLYTYQRESFAMDRENHSQWTARVLASNGADKPAQETKGSVARKPDRAQRHCRGGLRRVDHGNAERIFQRRPQPSHTGTAHDDGTGAVLVFEGAADLDHLRQRSASRGGLRHAHVERSLAGQPVYQPHLAKITDMPADRTLRDGDDAKGFGARHRRQHAAFGDAEHRPISSFPADMQARIAVAGDHEGCRTVIALDQPAQRHRHAVDIGLALDPVRTLDQRCADDLRSVREIERFQGLFKSLGHGDVGIGIDHEDARAGHGLFLAASVACNN